jgi:hypothetical protein
MVTSLLEQLYNSGLAGTIRESLYLFPLIESFHVIGLTMVFGTIAIMDLRMLGLASTSRPFSRVKSDILKWTWVAFVLTVVTGLLMFITNAPAYFANLHFRLKMLSIALAGLNMVVFEWTTGRAVRRWDTDRSAPAAGKLAGALSILLWIGVIFFGRWIGFTVGGEAAAPTTIEDPSIEDIFK